MQHGLLAGGLADGSVCLWDPEMLIDGSAKTKNPLLARLQKHTAAVRSPHLVVRWLTVHHGRGSVRPKIMQCMQGYRVA